MNEPVLTELPFGLKGRIYRSPMPFGSNDLDGVVYLAYKAHAVSVIVVLANDEECLQKARRNLRELYSRDGYITIYFPISDFSIPSTRGLGTVLGEMITHATAGRNVAIHCSAGIGRTGLLAACLARKIFGLSGERAIAWVRRHISGAVETPEQRQFVTDGQWDSTG